MKHEIWIGQTNLGQGSHDSTEPRKIAEIEAPDFRTACFIYELRRKLKYLESEIEKGNYIPPQSWDYDVSNMYNSWWGKRYPSYEEALKSFEPSKVNSLPKDYKQYLRDIFDLKEYILYTNVEEVLKNRKFYSVINFNHINLAHGNVWFENGVWYCELIFKSGGWYRTIESEKIENIIDSVRKEVGYEECLKRV